MKSRKWNIFVSSLFFVLGFSIIFSLAGVLLQSALSSVSFAVQKWLARAGGLIIIIFGIHLLGLIKINFLEREHKLSIKRKFKSSHLTSFIFGAAFAIGWTPCIGAVLGAILTLAVTQPYSAFFLLLSYSIGLGAPFLLVGFFTNQSKSIIDRIVDKGWLKWIRYLFGAVLIAMGIFVFTNQLSQIANFPLVTNLLVNLDLGLSNFSSLNIGIAFIAGIISFLSPCILPLIPAYLTYLASTAIKDSK